MSGGSQRQGYMKRVKVSFADLEIDFVDRDLAIRQVEELAEKGTWVVHVIYGPEGCGKTALFRQATEVLRDHGYAVTHINPLAEAVEERFSFSEELGELARELGVYLAGDASKLIERAVELLYAAVRRGVRKRIALLADDVFQAIGLDRAEQLVKSLLNMIEWPSIRYEKIVVLVASSEGLSAERVGRHRWADLYTLWNMPREGFKQLYSVLPDPKPSFEEVWGWTGGNPQALEMLFVADWDFEEVAVRMMRGRRLDDFVGDLDSSERARLGEAVRDPDALAGRDAKGLRGMLIERNLIISMSPRKPYLWVDEPPPERDPELGVGSRFAWQTPLHREAVKMALEQV